jgi:hypothetical protein
MSSTPDYERLDTTYFTFTAIRLKVAVLTVDYGDGYGDGALVGSDQGLRGWSVQINVLLDLEDYGLIHSYDPEGQTPFVYLFNFILRSKVAGNRPFILRDPNDGRDYFAEFVEHGLNLEMMTSALFSTGLELRQRRVRDFDSPSEPTDGENPFSI